MIAVSFIYYFFHFVLVFVCSLFYSFIGGAGTFLRLKGPNCLITPCRLEPGVQYDLEIEYLISKTTASQTLKMFILLTPITIPIVDAVMENSAAEEGTQVLLDFSIVPNAELEGVSKIKLIINVKNTFLSLI